MEKIDERRDFMSEILEIAIPQLLHFVQQALLVLGLHGSQRHAQVVLTEVQGGNAGLCGDGVDFAEQRIDQGQKTALHLSGGLEVACTISVVSNVAPKESVAMTDAAAAGDFKTAAEMQCKLLPLINALFCEVNPIPAKAAVAAMGFGENYLRMPLTPMEPANEERLLNEMKKLGVIA